MSLQLQFLREKIDTARNLLGVVETMRGLAAVNIRRAEAVAAQSDNYARTVHLSLHAALSTMDRAQLRSITRTQGRHRPVGERSDDQSGLGQPTPDQQLIGHSGPVQPALGQQSLGHPGPDQPAPEQQSLGSSGPDDPTLEQRSLGSSGPDQPTVDRHRSRQPRADRREPLTMLVITTDMGLCGQFNERIVDYALNLSQREAGGTCRWIVVGVRGWERLQDADGELAAHLDAPGSVEAIPTSVTEAFVALSGYLSDERRGRLFVAYNRPDDGGTFSPHHLQLAPFEPDRWLRWPDGESPWYTPPMTSSNPVNLLPHLVREQVYIDLFQAFIQSFAAENAARLSSMRNAVDNIEELLADLELRYRRERQDVITNELMELLGGVEAVSAAR